MPTTLPSPVDRDEFRFVAVNPEGGEWQWIDDEMVCLRVGEESTDDGADGSGVLH